MKLKYKLPLVLFVAFVAIIALSFAASLSGSAKLSELARYESGKSLAQANSEAVRSFLEVKVAELKALEKSVLAKKNLGDKDKSEVLSALLNSFADGPAVSDVYAVFERGAYFSEKLTKAGTYYNIDAFIPEDGSGVQVFIDTSYGITDQDDWYNVPKETKKMQLTEPYDWLYPGEKRHRKMITLSSPIVIEGKFVGAAGIDIELELLQKEIFDDMIDKEVGSYAMLVSHMGVVAAHPDESKLLQKAGFDVDEHDRRALLQAIRNGEYFRAIKKDEKTGREFLASYVPMKLGGFDVPWSLVYVAPLDAMQSDWVKTRNSTILMGLVCIAAWGVFLFVFMSAVFGSVTRTVAALGKMTDGDGDLTIRFEERGRDEFGQMARGLNRLIEKLHLTISTTQKETTSLLDTSNKLYELANFIAKTSDAALELSAKASDASVGASDNVQAIAGGTEEASEGAGELASVAEQMGTNLHSVTEAVEEMSARFVRITDSMNESKAIAAEANAMAADATKAMSELGASAMEIARFTDVIKGIAKKTNLLALNATVEAARAGDAGKGFAVVAGEIKGLANQSAASADDITRRIEVMQGVTNNAVEVIKSVTATITKINDSLMYIVNSIEKQTKASTDMADNARQTNDGAKRVVASIDDIANTLKLSAQRAGSAAEGTKSVSDSMSVIREDAQKTSDSSVELEKAASQLKYLSEHLNSIVCKFKT